MAVSKKSDDAGMIGSPGIGMNQAMERRAGTGNTEKKDQTRQQERRRFAESAESENTAHFRNPSAINHPEPPIASVLRHNRHRTFTT
jgi:hypothetical protein